MSILSISYVFRVDTIVVQPYSGSSIKRVTDDMFILEHKTGALVTCVFNGVELSTNYRYSAELLADYYSVKLRENK